MNKKIYINARYLTQNLSGVQQFAYQISLFLSNYYKDRIIFLVPKRSKIIDLYSNKFNIQKMGKFKGHLWEQIDLPIFLGKNNNPLLISLTNSNPVFYKRSVSTIHDLSIYKNKKWFKLSYRLFYKLLIPLLVKNSIYILTVSKFCKNELISKFAVQSNKISVIYNAVSFKSIDNISKKNKDYILFVGSLSERKNLNNLIEAFLLINKNNLKLKIVGAKYKHLNIDNRFTDKNIQYLGNVSNEELIDLYLNAKMLVFPSFYEGFGIPPLEAMYFKCPVLLSDIPVLKEVYGKSAVYFNPYDIQDIKKNICEIINNDKLRKKIIKLGSQKIKEYSWQRSSKKIITLIQKIEN